LFDPRPLITGVQFLADFAALRKWLRRNPDASRARRRRDAIVRLIFRRYLELSSVNELLRDLKERNARTRTKQLSTGTTRGGIPFGRGALYYVLSNHFYIGEVKYKNEILPGEQPPFAADEPYQIFQQVLIVLALAWV